MNFRPKNDSIALYGIREKCARSQGGAVKSGRGRSGILDLPVGYSMTSGGGLNIVVKDGYAESFDGFAMPDAASTADGESAPLGRGPLTQLALAGRPSERALVRRCVRGGVVGRLIRELYLGGRNPRPLEELRVSEYARARGVPTPEALAAIVQPVGPFLYKGALAVREISPSADLEAELAALKRPVDRETLARKRGVISSLGRLIAKMHGAGIRHADLHLKNILLPGEKGGPELYLLDLDRAKVHDPLSDFRKRSNILRLYRSVEKVNRRGKVITRTDLLRFVMSYAGESSQSARELTVRLGRMLPAWRLKWKLSDALGV